MALPLLESHVPGHEPRRGKVRDVYDLGDRVLLVATDRISAFDWILPTGIADKGRVLTQISRYWFEQLVEPLGIAHHLITTEVSEMGLPEGTDLESLAGRTMLCRKSEVVPFECVARGYLAGSGWNEYQVDGTVCKHPLPEGLVESSQLAEPIFTPATKAEQGDHDENVPYDRVLKDLGKPLAEKLRALTLKLYSEGAKQAATKGVLIADTKFEFGQVANDRVDNGQGDRELLIIDEILTPDSSRFWPAGAYEPGRPQASFDKQFVRDWLLASDWDRESTPPELPEEVVEQTRAKYVEAFEKLTGLKFAW